MGEWTLSCGADRRHCFRDGFCTRLHRRYRRAISPVVRRPQGGDGQRIGTSDSRYSTIRITRAAIKDKDLTVADFPRLRGMNDGVNTGIHDAVRAQRFSLYLRQVTTSYIPRRDTARCGLKALTSVTVIPVIPPGQRFTDIVQLEGLIIASIFFMRYSLKRLVFDRTG